VESFDGRLRDECLNENRFDDLAKPPHPVEERSNSDLINYEQRQCHCVTSGANIFYGKRLSGADPNQFLNGLLDALGRNTANGLSDGRNCGLLGGPRRLLSRRATGARLSGSERHRHSSGKLFAKFLRVQVEGYARPAPAKARDRQSIQKSQMSVTAKIRFSRIRRIISSLSWSAWSNRGDASASCTTRRPRLGWKHRDAHRRRQL
jgi:hypothetical protein